MQVGAGTDDRTMAENLIRKLLNSFKSSQQHKSHMEVTLQKKCSYLCVFSLHGSRDPCRQAAGTPRARAAEPSGASSSGKVGVGPAQQRPDCQLTLGSCGPEIDFQNTSIVQQGVYL